MERERERLRQRHRERKRDCEREGERGRQTDRENETERETETEREIAREKGGERRRETETHTHTDRDRHTGGGGNNNKSATAWLQFLGLRINRPNSETGFQKDPKQVYMIRREKKKEVRFNARICNHIPNLSVLCLWNRFTKAGLNRKVQRHFNNKSGENIHS